MLADLRVFKTRKCEQGNHPCLLGPNYLNCPHYHSKTDRRRCPFSEDMRHIVYSSAYVEDFYSAELCSNFVEYLFHPSFYKTIACKWRNNKDYQSGLEYPGKCPHIYCPYLHQEDDLSSIQSFRALPTPQIPLPDNTISPSQPLIQLLKDPSSVNREQLEKLKARLSSVKAAELQNIKKIESFPAVIKDGESMPSIGQDKAKAEKSEKEKEEDWYTCYKYFHHGEKLPIVQDRHHQFKNFRDIINNSITGVVMKYIASFLNSEGGVLYVGIDDSSVVHGLQLSQHQFDKFLLSIDKEGKFNLYPPLMPQKYSIRRVPVKSQKKGRDLWVLEIKVTLVQKDRKILTTYHRQCFMRMNASTHKLDATDLIEYMRLNQEEKGQSESEALRELLKSLERPLSLRSAEELGVLRELGRELVVRCEGALSRLGKMDKI